MDYNYYEIENAHSLTVDMQKEAAKYEKLASLALQNEIDTIKNVLRGKYLYLTYPIRPAYDWINKLVHEGKECNEKASFEYLQHKINDMLDVEIDISSISFLNYSNDAYYIRFSLRGDPFGRQFELSIPETENVRKDNLMELDYGKLQLRYQVSECCWDIITSSYDEEELKNKFKEWLMPKPV